MAEAQATSISTRPIDEPQKPRTPHRVGGRRCHRWKQRRYRSGSGLGKQCRHLRFPPGSQKPSETINQGLEDPFRLAIDKPFSHLYVADPEVNKVLVYDYSSGELVNSITNGLKSVYGVAVSR